MLKTRSACVYLTCDQAKRLFSMGGGHDEMDLSWIAHSSIAKLLLFELT